MHTAVPREMNAKTDLAHNPCAESKSAHLCIFMPIRMEGGKEEIQKTGVLYFLFARRMFLPTLVWETVFPLVDLAADAEELPPLLH